MGSGCVTFDGSRTPAQSGRAGAHGVSGGSRWPGGGPGWIAEELALLGAADDEVIAARIGRTFGAVTQKRQAMKIKAFQDRRRATPPRAAY